MVTLAGKNIRQGNYILEIFKVIRVLYVGQQEAQSVK